MPTLAKELSQVMVGVGDYRIQLSCHVTHTTYVKSPTSQYSAHTRPSRIETKLLNMLYKPSHTTNH